MLDIAETVAKRAATKLSQNVDSFKQVDCDLSRDVKVKADKFLDEIIRKQLKRKQTFNYFRRNHKLTKNGRWISMDC